MSEPVISVILPTHNGARFISETLQSIESQSLPINELVCSDDESSDETVAIINAFTKEASFAVKCVSHRRDGVTANYLNALKHVTGDIIFVADQDDIWLENKTERVVRALERNDVSLVSHDCLIVDELLCPLGKTLRGSAASSRRLTERLNNANERANLEIYLQGGIPLLAHTLAFKSEIVPQLLAKPSQIDNWWFEEWVSCIALCYGRLHLVDEALVLYRQHGTQTSGGIEPAGASKRTISPALGKYDSRIQKMHYCAMLLKGESSHLLKHRIFAEYAMFLARRQAGISADSAIVGMGTIIRQFANRSYTRYAKGVKSAGLDVVTHFKKTKV